MRFSELIDDVLEYVADHKDVRSYISKAEIVRKAVGSRPAAEITIQELERWLRSHCKTPATTNRYKASSRFAIGKEFTTTRPRSILQGRFVIGARESGGSDS